MDSKLSERNVTLDVIKLIASYFVVFIHVPFPGEFGVVTETAARFAVPVFFIASGFFGYGNGPDKIKRKMKNIFFLFLFASALYNLLNIALRFVSENGSVPEYIAGFFKPEVILKLVLLNCTYSSDRLWFLLALIYVYAFYCLACKFGIKEKVIFGISFAGLALHLLLGEVLLAFGTEVPYEFLRNFLLMGIPFFGIGMFLKKYEEKICGICNIRTTSTIVAGGVTLSIASRYLIGRNELYLGSAAAAIAVTVLAIKLKDVKYPSYIVKLASCSTGIYIFHKTVEPFVNFGSKMIFSEEQSVLAGFIVTIAVCIGATICAWIFNIFMAYMKKRKAKLQQ